MNDMKKLGKVLDKQINGGYVCYGCPTTEKEFRKMFRKVMYEDINGNAVLSSNPDDFGLTWTQLKAELDKL